MTRTEEALRAAYNTPLDAAALQRLSVTIGELSGATWPEPRPRSRGRRLAPLLSAAAVLLLAGGVAVGVNHGHDRIAGSAARSTDNEDPALRLWAQFPVHASPRPVVLTEGAVNDPATGFPNGEAKFAYMSGSFELAAALPPDHTTKDGQHVITAQKALTVLRGAGRGQSVTPTLKITDVRLGTDTFSTDRGQRSLPAWLFTFAGVAQPASVVAISDPWPHSGMPSTPDGRLMSVTSATTAADGHRLTISFLGAAPGSGPCSADYAADVEQSATAVLVSVRTLPAPSPSSAAVCATMAYERRLTVTLRSPLGDRVLIDTTGVPVPVT